MKNSKFIKYSILYILLYFVLSIPLWFLYRFYTAPDYISYMSIAHKYMVGNFADAVNAYWGPMFSWLMVPFLFVGISAFWAGKIILWFSGAVILVLAGRLLLQFGVSRQAYHISMAALIPVVIYYVFMFLSPDILLAMFLLAATVFMFSEKYEQSLAYAFYVGILGALAYFCKQYGLIFFFVNFMFFLFNRFVHADGKEKLREVFRGFTVLAVALIISACWISILHAKYDVWMIGSTGQYNLAIGPDPSEHIHRIKGLIELPNESAVVAWEDPTFYKYEPRHVSLKKIGYFLPIMLHNLQVTIVALTNISILSFAILMYFFLMQIHDNSIQDKNKLKSCFFNISEFIKSIFTDKEWCFLVSFIVFTGGYLPVYSDIRYISFPVVLLIVIGGVCLNAVLKSPFFQDKFRRSIFIIIYVVSFMFYPSIELINNSNTGKYQYKIAESLKIYFPRKNSRIATNLNWHDTLYIADRLNCKYLGKTKSSEINDELLKELEDHNIEYFLYWNDGGESEFIDGFDIIDHQVDNHFTLYKKATS